jgi:hypothetical protein
MPVVWSLFLMALGSGVEEVRPLAAQLVSELLIGGG